MKNVLIGLPTTKWQALRDLINSQNIEIDTTHSNQWNYPTQIKGWNDWETPDREQGLFQPIDNFDINSDDRIITIVKDPFELLYDYWNTNWGWNRVQHETNTFGEFLNIYLDRTQIFHAPAYRASLFSQLKDIEGNWLLDDNSIVLSYNDLSNDISELAKEFGITIHNHSEFITNTHFRKEDMYTSDQIEQLTQLWKDDLEYFSDVFKRKAIQIKRKEVTPKTKIAICFSGHLRDLERTKDYWLELINKYDIDVYASFWDVENVEIGDTINNFHKIYNVKKMEVERYDIFDKSTLEPLRHHINPPNTILSNLMKSCNDFGTMAMWYKVWRANMLTNSFGIDYDVVIRARTDIFFTNPLTIDIDNTLSVPNGRIRLNNYNNSDGISDLFAYGSPKMMNYYSTCYFFMMEHLGKGHYMVPHEHFLHTHMNKISVPIKFMKEGLNITRTSKGTADERYCDTLDKDHIVLSDFMELIPNKDVVWVNDIKKTFTV